MSPVKIKNSSRIITPWSKLAYSAYLNYCSDYSDDIDGTSVGAAFEWEAHNLGYYASSGLSEVLSIVDEELEELDSIQKSCKEVNLGPTIFDDLQHGKLSTGMHLSYCILSPVAALIDILIWEES